ncbi:unnamed protein product [Schistosoma margrebowiei]|uniref:Uncharacterized protein n=1 Tax=Schistosoma margrebowiei TaxID=48269 RepID=A0A183LD09_9TREM|nr:unnamed protein product [Schistosoma margrebowiei]
MTAEKSEREGNMRESYEATKKLTGNYRKLKRPVKSKEINVITKLEEQQNRWEEQFKELMNRPALLNTLNIEVAPTYPPTIEEISMAIGQIKSGKAEGSVNTLAYALKADVTARLLTRTLLPSPDDRLDHEGVNIWGKSKILRYNTTCTDQITLDGETLEDIKTFTYLSSITDVHGGSDADVKERIGKARAAYLQLKNIWNSKQLSANTNLRIFNTNVKVVLLYVMETLRTTKAINQKIRVFINSFLRKTLRTR